MSTSPRRAGEEVELIPRDPATHRSHVPGLFAHKHTKSARHNDGLGRYTNLDPETSTTANFGRRPPPNHGEYGISAPDTAYSSAHHWEDPTPAQVENGIGGPDYKDTRAISRSPSPVPGDSTLLKKGGLRTFTNDPDQGPSDKWTFNKFMIFVAMGFLWTASQIPLYLYGGIIPQIEDDIGGEDRYAWLLLGYLIPLASVTPFVGPFSDLFGRRNVALFAAVITIVGCIVNSTAHSMNVFIGGMVLLGIGAGILELTSLAVAGESAPTKHRGAYIGAIILTIIPYCPSVLYAQLIVAHASWRYIGLWCALWTSVGLFLTTVYYWPPRRANRGGLSKREIMKRMDFTGGLLSTAGLTLFLMGLTWSSSQYSWDSAHVRVTLILGAVLMVMFGIWETFLVKYPMFPRRLGTNPMAFTVVLVITFVSGANFFAVLVFWPTQYFVQYAKFDDPVSVGVGSLPVGFCIIGGSIVFSILVSLFKGKVKIMMIISCCIMTAGNGAMAAARVDNLGWVYVAVTFACLGVGAVIVPLQVIATVVCPDDLIATVTALNISVRFVGGAIGYTVYYYVLRNNFTEAATEFIAPAALKAGVKSVEEIEEISMAISGNLIDKLPLFPSIDTPEKVADIVFAGRQAFAAAYPEVYYVSIAFGGVAIIASFLLPDITKFMDNNVAVQYGGGH